MIDLEQVNENPSPNDFRVLQTILRSYGHAINKLILAPDSVLTANLPAAGAANDGLIVVENAGGTTRNLIVYSAGVRTRFTGTNF